MAASPTVFRYLMRDEVRGDGEFVLRIYEPVDPETGTRVMFSCQDKSTHCIGHLFVAHTEVDELLRHLPVIRASNQHCHLDKALVGFHKLKDVLTRNDRSIALMPVDGALKDIFDAVDGDGGIARSILSLRTTNPTRDSMAFKLALEHHRALVCQYISAQSASTDMRLLEYADPAPSNLPQLLRAIQFATIAHQYQKRKGKEELPYIGHPIDVLCRLSGAGIIDVDVMMAGVSHDVLEDTKTTDQELGAIIGERALAIVKECSDDKSLDKVTRKKQQIEHAGAASVAAKQVKLADKLSNLSDLLRDPPTHWSPEEMRGYQWWSLAVVRACGERSSPILFKELMQLLQSSDVQFTNQDALDAELAKYYENLNHSE